MPLLNLIPPDQAQGKVKEAYSVFDQLPMVPTPFMMYSPSEQLITTRAGMVRYYMTHPTLSPGLLALIRLLVAEEMNFHYCVSLNSMVLKSIGIVDDDQLAKILADPSTAPLDDKDKAMLAFVVKAIKTPDDTSQEDVDGLRALGWTDRDILEATEHGIGMVAGGIMFKIMKMGEGAAC